MNVLVTGANGQLGSEIQNNTHRISNYYFSDADSLDITDAQAIRAFVKQHAINLIVNCAAYTKLKTIVLPPKLSITPLLRIWRVCVRNFSCPLSIFLPIMCLEVLKTRPIVKPMLLNLLACMVVPN